MMINRGKINLMALMSNIDMSMAQKDVPAEVDTSKCVSINFAGIFYNVSFGLQDDWHFVIQNEAEHLVVKIKHAQFAINPEIRAYIHGDEVKHEETDFIFIETLCYHIEYELFSRLLKRLANVKQPEQSVAETVGLMPKPKEFVREFLALTPKKKREVWIKINNPTTNPSKINSQCTKVLTNSKKYSGYEPVKNKETGLIITREP